MRFPCMLQLLRPRDQISSALFIGNFHHAYIRSFIICTACYGLILCACVFGSCCNTMTQSYDLYATGRKAIVNLRKAKSAQILDALCYINHIFVLVF